MEHLHEIYSRPIVLLSVIVLLIVRLLSMFRANGIRSSKFIGSPLYLLVCMICTLVISITIFTCVQSVYVFFSRSKLGTKSDLTVGINIVQVEEGEKMRRKIYANQFLECSAKQNENINEVIYEAIRAAVAGPVEPPNIGIFETVRRFVCCSNDEF